MRSRPAGLLRRTFRIKPGERKLAVLLFWYFFLVSVPQAIINPLRTAFFLGREGVAWLPIAYLLAVGATGLVVLTHGRFEHRKSVEALIIASLAFFAASGLLLHGVLRARLFLESKLLSYYYWTWASVLVIVLMTGFWMTVNEIYNPRQAKRLVGFLNSGGILGGIAGGLLVGFLAEGVLGAWLLPLASVLLAGSIFVVRAVFRLQRTHSPGAGQDRTETRLAASPKTGFLDSFAAVRKDGFLASTAAIVAIGIVVATCIEYQFLSASWGHFPNSPAALESFFGFFEPALTVFALGLNFLVARYLLKRLTVVRTLLLAPAGLLVSSAVALLAPFGLPTGILVRGTDESLSFSISHPLREILYIPVAAERRQKAKAFIEMFVSQFAKVAGAVVLLVFAVLMNKPVEGLTPRFDPTLARYLSAVVIALLIPWAALSLKVGREYLVTLKANIKPLWPRAEVDLAQKVDVEHAMLVFDTIDSGNTSSVLYALHLFDLLARDKLSPDVRKVIAEIAEEVRVRASQDRIEEGAAAVLPDILEEISPGPDMAEIPLILSSKEYQEVMAAYADKVLAGGPAAEVAKMELAKVIGLMDPASPLAGRLNRLIEDGSPRVSALALQSAGRLRNAEDIPAIIRKLGVFTNLEDAVEALHKYSDTAVGPLVDEMHDRSAGFAERMAAVEVLTRIGTPRAVQALTEEFEHGTGELDDGLIDALDRLRAERKDVPLSVPAAKKKTLALIKSFCRTFLEIQEPGRSKEAAQLRHHLARSLAITLAETFKLLGLYYPQEDIRKVYQNIKTGTPSSTGHAVEWLDYALGKDLKDALLPIVDDLTLDEKKERFREILEDLADL